MALKLRCLHKIGVINCDSPDALVTDVTDHFDIDALFPADSGPFQYDEWSQVNTDAGQRMNIVSKSSDRASFIKLFKPQLFEFKEHVSRVRNQYHALQDLKANLPRNRIIVQMDFAENFNCKTADEHKDHFGVVCTWNYFEAGHGKGPCDGIGGTVKRCADLAIKQRKCTIQSADVFYTWASSSNISVAFKYISKEDISRYSIILNENIAKNCKPVKRTLKLH
ncbi:unnamed protein product [Mytilus coruscus]|uniref:Uncharacterized protein n=1 Tax=Mytilus coruscus TaxID=42192 RepID=A0A6J8DDS9_MYTCO|nr:unnamed protein product [Mytilus coruscus]